MALSAFFSSTETAVFTVVFDVVTRRLTRLVGGDVDIEAPYVEE